MADVVFALSLGEIHPGQPVVAGEPVHRLIERFGDTGQRRGRGNRQPQLPMHIPDQASRVLQPRHVGIAEHAVDAFDLKDHMLGQDIGDRSRYGHDGLRTEMGRPVGQPTAMTVHTPCRSAGHGLHPPTGAPYPRRPRHASSGWGEAPLDLCLDLAGDAPFDAGPCGSWQHDKAVELLARPRIGVLSFLTRGCIVLRQVQQVLGARQPLLFVG